MLGGNFVNRFNIDGRSYKVIPQIERAGRLTPDQLERHPRHRPERPAHAAVGRSRRIRDGRRAAHAQPLPAAQRRSRSPAWRRARSTAALRVLEDAAAQDPAARATASTTPASRASCGRRAASSCPRWAWRSLLIFLVLAAQFNSFRDPFVILAGSVPLAMFGALIFTFLKFAGPPGHALRAHRGLDDDAQHLLAGRPGHAGRASSPRTAS